MRPLANVLVDDAAVVVSGWGEVPSWDRDAMVLSPSTGKWYPHETFGTVEPGSVLGEIRDGRTIEVVCSPYRARVLDNLELEGHPVERGRPLVWVERVA